MSVVHYDVRCAFSEPLVAERWLAWLVDEHLADVISAGAIDANVVRLRDEGTIFEVRYRFPDQEAYARYVRDHAPRLQADGLARFPVSLGLSYSRTVSDEIVPRKW